MGIPYRGLGLITLVGTTHDTSLLYAGTVQWGSCGDAWWYWGVPLTPLTTQGERGGIPWPR